MPRKLHIERDLEIIDSHRHEISGAQFILARLKKSSPESFIIAWVAPWQKTIGDYTMHDKESSAGALFEIDRHITPPETPALTRDWQVTKVYDWENKTVCRADALLTKEAMEKAVRDISATFNLAAIPALDLRRHRLTKTCGDWDGEGNRIRIREKTREKRWRLSHLLHEMAHAIDEKVNGNRWAAHGPSFVRTFLATVETYNKWHDIAELEQAAAAQRVMITPASALPHLQTPNAD